MMFERLMQRAERSARSRAEALAGRLGERLAGVLPAGASVQRAGARIVIAGKRLRLRVIGDARLRSIAALVREIVP